jgi:tetratricopeptide (TPR) repeat protein
MARDVTLQEALSFAFTAVDEGRLVVAEDLCRQILAAKPDTFGAHHLLGIAQSRLGKKTEALESYGSALSLRPDSAEVFSNRGDELRDFTDTAALIANLDLVIAVDTSVAHLAGALAKPLWMLLSFGSDWRWLLDRDDSPWYPTARIFRQDAVRSWGDVIARALAALAELVSSRK